MNRTKIEWAKNPDGTPGYTWNPITGCNNQIDGLCGGSFPCYAYQLANTSLKERYLANKNTATKNYDEDSYPFYPRFREDRLWDIPAQGKPKGIFTCDMSDLFGIGIPEEWTNKVLNRIRIEDNHRFYLLTKQPQNLIKFSPFPDNAWVGVSWIGDDKSRPLRYLTPIDAKLKFISFEPLLQFPKWWNVDLLRQAFEKAGIKWVIIGACTGTKEDLLPLHHKTSLMMVRLNGNRWVLLPQIEWVAEIVQACDKAGVAVFLKDNLMPLMKPVYGQAGCISNFFTGGDGETPVLRQEMPKGGVNERL